MMCCGEDGWGSMGFGVVRTLLLLGVMFYL